MSYHFIDISESGAIVTVKDRQLVGKTKDGNTRSVPLEDVGAVLVTSFSAVLHNSFLVEAAKERVSVVLCERYRPVSILLPIVRGADTLLTRAQITAPSRFREILWRKTIDAKVSNQQSLLEDLSCDESLLQSFCAHARRTDSGREGNCARLYWQGIAAYLGREGFHRSREGEGLNTLLNYGYGVLLTRILQKLLAVGLDPMYGIGHAVRERAAPLAYDLMEPFRPFFDHEVVNYVKASAEQDSRLVVDAAFKRTMLGVLQCRFSVNDEAAISIDHAMDRTVESLREAFLTGKTTAYKPWTRRSSKWDG